MQSELVREKNRTGEVLRAVRLHCHLTWIGSPRVVHIFTWFGPLASKRPTDQSRRQSSTAQSGQSTAVNWLLSATALRRGFRSAAATGSVCGAQGALQRPGLVQLDLQLGQRPQRAPSSEPRWEQSASSIGVASTGSLVSLANSMALAFAYTNSSPHSCPG